MAIPKKIIQLTNRDYVDESIEDNIRNIKHLNKGWTHILFDDLQAEEFIEKKLWEVLADTFRSISENYWPAKS